MTNNDVAAKQEESTKAVHARRFLTVEAEHRPERVEMELRGDLPIGILFPILIKTLGWRTVSDEADPRFRLIAVKDGKEIELKNSDTLISADIPSGSELKIMFVNKKGAIKGIAQDTILGLEPIPGLENGFAVGGSPDRRASIAPPHWDEPVKEPCLIAASGNVYPIRNPPVWIGRPDKGFRPEVNLVGEEDRDNPTVGRRHAQLFHEDENYILRPKPSLNGTFVNGTEIRQSQSCVLRDGDQVKFGDVELIFRLP